MPNYYDSIAEGYNELHGAEQARKARKILDQIELNENSKILDVGGGTGIATEFFPGDITILDPCGGLLSKVKGKKVLGSAESLPFPDKSFDLAISLTAIHHYDDPEKALSEMKRVSRKYVAVTALKKSKKHNELCELIRKMLPSSFELNDSHDSIFVCKN